MMAGKIGKFFTTIRRKAFNGGMATLGVGVGMGSLLIGFWWQSQENKTSSVSEVADLFLGEHPGNIVKLDLSSNFILPTDLLEFSRRIEAYHPLHRFTLDLHFNPLNHDPEVKSQALRMLLPFCEVLTDEWDFRSAMVDHVSVM